MNTHQLVSRLVEAGINPAAIVTRVNGEWRALAVTYHPGLSDPTDEQLDILRSRGIPALRRPRPAPSGTSGVGSRANNQGRVGAGIDLSRTELRDPSLAHVFAGWNVWAVDQVDDLPASVEMAGLSRETQLQIWVEDQVRLHAPGTAVADPIALKGSQIEILAAAPVGLSVSQHKEQVPGAPMLTDGPASLRYVRFFNRGLASDLPWPHDGSYILDQILTPSPNSPATSGPGPGTLGGRLVDPATDLLKGALAVVAVGTLAMVGVQMIQARRRRA